MVIANPQMRVILPEFRVLCLAAILPNFAAGNRNQYIYEENNHRNYGDDIDAYDKCSCTGCAEQGGRKRDSVVS